MIEYILFFLFFIVLSTIQSIIGIGVLVLGTPILLIFEFTLHEILSILLPVSILTSLLNIIIIKKNYKNFYKKINNNTKFIFYTYCLPSIIIGLLFLKYFSDLINFKLLVSLLILFSLLIKFKFKNQVSKIKIKHIKIVFSLIGIIHGLTNSGGTLISLFISSLEKNFRDHARIIITFFYLVLASIQYFLFVIIFWKNTHDIKHVIFFLGVLIGVILGNFLIKFINEKKLKLSVEILAALTAFILFFKGLNFI